MQQRECWTCKAELYEDEPGWLCQDCHGVFKQMRRVHRGEDNDLRGARRTGASGLRFLAVSQMSHDHPGHAERMAAHEARVRADLAELKRQATSKKGKRHAVRSSCGQAAVRTT
jgi:hypothetical protein